MKKSMLISKGKVFVSDKEGIKPGVDFTNNIVDIITLEEMIEYLDNQVNIEHKELDDKEHERKSRLADYKKMLLFSTGASVVCPVALSLLFGMHKTTMDTIFGEMNGLVGFSTIMIPSLLVLSQFLCSYGLTMRPSKNYLNGCAERLNYQVEVVNNLKCKLGFLKEDKSADRIGDYEENVPIEIDVDTKLKYYQDSAKLRYVYGSQYKRVMKLYHSGELKKYLKDSGMEELAIVDFIIFIEDQLAKEKEDARVHGRAYKAK